MCKCVEYGGTKLFKNVALKCSEKLQTNTTSLHHFPAVSYILEVHILSMFSKIASIFYKLLISNKNPQGPCQKKISGSAQFYTWHCTYAIYHQVCTYVYLVWRLMTSDHHINHNARLWKIRPLNKLWNLNVRTLFLSSDINLEITCSTQFSTSKSLTLISSQPSYPFLFRWEEWATKAVLCLHTP